MWPFLGLFLIGPALQVLVPYIRKGLELVAETGSLSSWPMPNWAYLAMFLFPILEYGVAFLTIEGLPTVVAGWTLVQAILFAYSGTHFGKEIVLGGAALVKLANGAIRR